jgi:hypothetical protein
MKQVIKKLFGIDKVEKSIAIATKKLEETETQLAKAKEDAELVTMSEKDRATRKKEPWVGVINTHVNKDNIRNGFFELDWNTYFVEKLKNEGYGLEGDPEEEIVDRWFRELCANVVVDGDYGGAIVDAGSLDINAVKKANE